MTGRTATGVDYRPDIYDDPADDPADNTVDNTVDNTTKDKAEGKAETKTEHAADQTAQDRVKDQVKERTYDRTYDRTDPRSGNPAAFTNLSPVQAVRLCSYKAGEPEINAAEEQADDACAFQGQSLYKDFRQAQEWALAYSLREIGYQIEQAAAAYPQTNPKDPNFDPAAAAGLAAERTSFVQRFADADTRLLGLDKQENNFSSHAETLKTHTWQLLDMAESLNPTHPEYEGPDSWYQSILFEDTDKGLYIIQQLLDYEEENGYPTMDLVSAHVLRETAKEIRETTDTLKLTIEVNWAEGHPAANWEGGMDRLVSHHSSPHFQKAWAARAKLKLLLHGQEESGENSENPDEASTSDSAQAAEAVENVEGNIEGKIEGNTSKYQLDPAAVEDRIWEDMNPMLREAVAHRLEDALAGLVDYSQAHPGTVLPTDIQAIVDRFNQLEINDPKNGYREPGNILHTESGGYIYQQQWHLTYETMGPGLHLMEGDMATIESAMVDADFEISDLEQYIDLTDDPSQKPQFWRQEAMDLRLKISRNPFATRTMNETESKLAEHHDFIMYDGNGLAPGSRELLQIALDRARNSLRGCMEVAGRQTDDETDDETDEAARQEALTEAKLAYLVDRHILYILCTE